MAQLLEAAAFRMDDGDCLVSASLSCSACLSADVEWSLNPVPFEESVECECRSCGHRRTVYLSPEQALRLSLHVEHPLDPTPRPLGEPLGM
jgi:hypothetical protein